MSIKQTLWKAKLNSEFNSRYWRYISEKYSRYDLWIRIILALSASGTVAGWGIWSDIKIVWQGLSGIAAVLSIASPLIAFSKKAESAASHAGLWANLRTRYARIWDEYSATNKTSVSIERELNKLTKLFSELEGNEPKLNIPYDKKISIKSQLEVKQFNNIKEK